MLAKANASIPNANWLRDKPKLPAFINAAAMISADAWELVIGNNRVMSQLNTIMTTITIAALVIIFTTDAASSVVVTRSLKIKAGSRM